LVHHEESAKIVNQAIAALGQGKKGLADRLNKDPSLISRYPSGVYEIYTGGGLWRFRRFAVGEKRKRVQGRQRSCHGSLCK